MKLAVYSAILHDRPPEEALSMVADLGLKGYELNTGDFLPPVHVPVEDILANPELAKDVRINRENAEIYGVLDERFRRLDPSENRTNIGGNEYVNEWPKDSA